ncbi:alpha/beta fold hydrolase [Stutzerimonas tarimensis]|uniref:Alpha/beta fold hydrolase n=1 Tax=Stutzerimonas tarimensis TaxID=1507735 RepID=A0ABV7T1Q8_9GAMM
MRVVVALGGGALAARAWADDPADFGFAPRHEAMDPGSLASHFSEVEGLRIHALRSLDAAPADAPALVLVHGSGLSGQYMIPTARELTDDFRLYIPDIPGYGDSGDPGRVLNVPEMADWLDAWMDAVDLPRASFLGNSFGCQVIADLAARYPARVDRAILQGPTTPPDERSGFWQFIRWRQNNAYNPDWLGDVTADDYEKAGLWRLFRSFMYQITDRIEDKAPRVEAPVLVIRGEHDPIAHQAFCDLLVTLFPNGELHIIPEVAHTLVVTAPDEVARATRDFILEAPA